MKSTKSLVSRTLPDFVVDSYPKFVEFLQSYYEFLKSYDLDVNSFRDPDLSADNLVFFLKQEFSNKFPTARIDDRKLIKIVRKIYQAKGTVNALEILFRIFFNEAITVSEPNKNLLKASDGKWIQDSSVRIRIRYINQSYDVNYNDIRSVRIENESGVFFLQVDRVEEPVQGDLVFHYKSFNAVNIEENQNIDYVSDSGDLILRGVVVEQPSKLTIVSPGKYWKLGQVITIPGTIKDTVARVTGLTSTGGIRSIEIVEYGFDHALNQSTIVSPFPNKPINSILDLEVNIVGYNPFTEQYEYSYELTLGESVDVFEEEIFATSDIPDDSSYFLENYVERGYVGKREFYKKTAAGNSSQIVLVDPSLSIAQWLESRAFLTFEFGTQIKTKGYYANTDGQLSTPDIRLQDSFFYQLFSYVIETQRNIEEYRNIVNQVHPAGLKFFGELAKTAIVTFGDFGISRTLSRNKIYADDVLDAFDTDPAKFVTKSEQDSIPAPTDVITNKIIGKVETDLFDPIDSTTIAVTINTSSNDTTVEDQLSSVQSIIARTSVTDPVTDLETKNTGKSVTEDDLISQDNLSASVNINSIEDESVSIDDGTAVTESITYNAEDYFAENYSTIDYLTNIG